MTFLIFLPLVLIVITGLIVWFTVVPFTTLLLKLVQLSNNTAVPFPHLTNGTLTKTPIIDVCTHGGNQTLDEGILCYPKDNNITLNSEGRGNV